MQTEEKEKYKQILVKIFEGLEPEELMGIWNEANAGITSIVELKQEFVESFFEDYEEIREYMYEEGFVDSGFYIHVPDSKFDYENWEDQAFLKDQMLSNVYDLWSTDDFLNSIIEGKKDYGIEEIESLVTCIYMDSDENNQ